jgi:hypothetical protein
MGRARTRALDGSAFGPAAYRSKKNASGWKGEISCVSQPIGDLSLGKFRTSFFLPMGTKDHWMQACLHPVTLH